VRSVRFGLLGLGTVGGGVVKLLDSQRATLEELFMEATEPSAAETRDGGAAR